MKFALGEIAIHIGGGDIAPNSEVEIIGVGPWGRHGFREPAYRLYNREPSDYCCKDLGDGQTFFTDESRLRKRPQQDDQLFTKWFNETILTDCAPSLEETKGETHGMGN